MMKYETDKPDLRNPLIIHDLTNLFKKDDIKFEIFKVSKIWIIEEQYHKKY